MYVHWAKMGRFRRAMGIAAGRGLSLFQIVRPYDRRGLDWRCDVWTLCGAFVGVLLGLGIGWAILDSPALGLILAGAGALISGWHYRVVASLLAVDGRPSAHQPAEARRGVGDGRLKLALAALVCGVAAAVVGLWRGDAHGPVAVVGFVAIVLFVAWRVVRIPDGQRAT